MHLEIQSATETPEPNSNLSDGVVYGVSFGSGNVWVATAAMPAHSHVLGIGFQGGNK